MPIVGVAIGTWTLFSIIYLYWLETVLLSVFNTIKIWTAVADAPTTFRIFNFLNHPGQTRLFIGLKYLLSRIFIMGFYMIFISIFIGLIASGKDDMKFNVQAVMFQNFEFNAAILVFLFAQFMDLYFNYYKDGLYKRTHPYDIGTFIDARTIVLHIVIVLGSVGYSFLVKDNQNIDEHTGRILFVSLFVFVKMLSDFIVYRLTKPTN